MANMIYNKAKQNIMNHNPEFITDTEEILQNHPNLPYTEYQRGNTILLKSDDRIDVYYDLEAVMAIVKKSIS